jgi:hypothetical protein
LPSITITILENGGIQVIADIEPPIVATQKESSGYSSWALLLFRPLPLNLERFWDSGAPIVALLIPRPLAARVVYLKHFFVNFFGSNASNRINEMDSADKKVTPLSE